MRIDNSLKSLKDDRLHCAFFGVSNWIDCSIFAMKVLVLSHLLSVESHRRNEIILGISVMNPRRIKRARLEARALRRNLQAFGQLASLGVDVRLQLDELLDKAVVGKHRFPDLDAAERRNSAFSLPHHQERGQDRGRSRCSARREDVDGAAFQASFDEFGAFFEVTTDLCVYRIFHFDGHVFDSIILERITAIVRDENVFGSADFQDSRHPDLFKPSCIERSFAQEKSRDDFVVLDAIKITGILERRYAHAHGSEIVEGGWLRRLVDDRNLFLFREGKSWQVRHSCSCSCS